MRAVGFISASFACVLATCAPASASNMVDYNQAIEAFQNGDYELAVEKFEDLTEQSPHWASGHLTLGQCYYLLGRAEQGDRSIRLAHELAPETDRFAAYMAPAQILYQRKRFDEAVAPLERALEFAPQARLEATSLRLASAYRLAGRYGEVREVLEAHLERHGFQPGPAYHLALACQRLGDYGCALDSLRRVLRAEAEEPEKNKVLGHLAEWSHYWALAPQNKDRRDELMAAAVDDTRAWYRAEPQNAEALEHYAELLGAAGNAEEVLRELVPVAQRDEQNCTVRKALASALNGLEKGRDAEGWARQATRCDPSMAGAHIELAVAYIRQLEPEQSSLEQVRHERQIVQRALESLDRAIRLQPADSRAAALRAEIGTTLEQLEQAEAEFIASDRDYQSEVAAATRQRCQAILWTLRDESRDLSPEELAFHHEHDCARLASKP